MVIIPHVFENVTSTMAKSGTGHSTHFQIGGDNSKGHKFSILP